MCFGVTVMPRVWCLVVVVASALLLSVDLSGAAAELKVEYPDRPDDYSQVILSCVDGRTPFEDAITDAVYYRNGTLLSNLMNVNVMPGEEGAIQFTLTQQQEGKFRCGPSDDEDNRSAPVGLAGKLL